MSLKILTKKEFDLKIIAVDDGRFFKNYKYNKHQKAPLFYILWKNFEILNMKISEIEVDGLDSTKKLYNMIKSLEFDIIFLNGISFGGFNLIDTEYLYNFFRKPIIIITGSKPNNRLIKKVLKEHFEDWKERFSLISKLGRINCIKTVYYEPIYFEVIGLNFKKAKRIIQELTFTGKYPEPIRTIRLLTHDILGDS